MANSRLESSKSPAFACLYLPHLKASFGFDRFGLHDSKGRLPRERACPQGRPRRRASVCTSTRERPLIKKFLLERSPLVNPARHQCLPAAHTRYPIILSNAPVPDIHQLENLNTRPRTLPCAARACDTQTKPECCAALCRLFYSVLYHHLRTHLRNHLFSPLEEVLHTWCGSAHTHWTHHTSIARLKACAIAHELHISHNPFTLSQNCLVIPEEDLFLTLHVARHTLCTGTTQLKYRVWI